MAAETAVSSTHPLRRVGFAECFTGINLFDPRDDPHDLGAMLIPISQPRKQATGKIRILWGKLPQITQKGKSELRARDNSDILGFREFPQIRVC